MGVKLKALGWPRKINWWILLNNTILFNASKIRIIQFMQVFVGVALEGIR